MGNKKKYKQEIPEFNLPVMFPEKTKEKKKKEPENCDNCKKDCINNPFRCADVTGKCKYYVRRIVK